MEGEQSTAAKYRLQNQPIFKSQRLNLERNFYSRHRDKRNFSVFV